jgi:uncharacterized protein YndB with AHSA1/START domain
MIRVELDEIIDRPIEQVFDRLVDIRAYPDWMSREGIFVRCTQDAEGPVEEGTPYTDETRLGTVHGQVSEFERPNKVTFHYEARVGGATIMHGWPGYELEPVSENRTRVRHRATARLRGPFKLFRPLVQRIATRERQLTVASLKDSLEARDA